MRETIKLDIHKIFQGQDNMSAFLNDLHVYSTGLCKFNQKIEECVEKEKTEESKAEFLHLTMSRLCGMAVFMTIYEDVFNRLKEEMKVEPCDIAALLSALRDGFEKEVSDVTGD